MSHLVDHLTADQAPTALPVDAPRESRYGGPDEDVVYVPVLRTPAKALPPGALPAAQLHRVPLDAVREYRSHAPTQTTAVATVRHLDLYRTILNAIPHGAACASERSVGIDCACDLPAQEADADAVTRAVEGYLRGLGVGVDQRTGTAWDRLPAAAPDPAAQRAAVIREVAARIANLGSRLHGSHEQRLHFAGADEWLRQLADATEARHPQGLPTEQPF